MALKKANEDSFNTFVDYITGQIKWIVVKDYNLQLLSFDEFVQMDYYALRLISIFGEDDGTFTYAVGSYSDDSGGYKKFIPFKNYDDAFSYFKKLVLSRDVSEQTLEIAKKYDFEFPKDEVDKWRKIAIENLKMKIVAHEAVISKEQEKIGYLLNNL